LEAGEEGPAAQVPPKERTTHHITYSTPSGREVNYTKRVEPWTWLFPTGRTNSSKVPETKYVKFN